MLTSRFLLPLGVALAASLIPSAFAAGPANRIAAVDGNRVTALPHSIPGRARAAADLGPAAADRRLSAVTLHFSRTEAQQTALDQLLADQQNPASPRFRQWLTPAQFGEQFGLSAADLAKVTAWLTAQGLTVEEVSPVNTYIRVAGTVAQIDQAFHANLHRLDYAGESHISNLSDPQLPSSIAGVTTGITGLSDFLPHSRARAISVRPEFTSSLTNNHYLSPADFNTIYDLGPLGSSAINGTGVGIAVLGQTDISLTDVAAFRSAAGLPANPPTVILNGADPGTVATDLLEAQLDVEWAGAIAPSAKVSFVNTAAARGGVFTSLVYAVTNRTAPIVSVSYGLCELSDSSSDLYSFNQYLQQANVQGQTVIAPGGDAGATDCDYQSLTAADGLAVDFPASSPNVTGVGGTMLSEGAGTYWRTASTSTGDIVSSALSYIPETVWNEYSSTYGLSAGGGGSSVLFSKPSWQTATGVPADFSRDVPDLSLNSAASHDPYLVCSSGSCTNGFRNAAQNLTAVGGTSAAVPSFAGILALIEQKTGQTGGLGNINPTLYGLAAPATYTSAFHDITSGNNSSPCAAGSPNCASGGSIGYSASTGYDLATGLGSVDGFNMANLWATAVPTSTVSTTGSRISVTAVSLPSGQASCGIQGSTLTLGVNVTSGTSTFTVIPSGTAQLLVDGTASGPAVTLANGSASLPLTASTLPSGAHTISVVYSGDANYASSKGSLSPGLSPVTPNNAQSYTIYVPSTLDVVSTSQPDFSLTPCLPTLTVRTGATSTPLTLTATSAAGFSGAVTFSVSSDANLLATYTLSSKTANVTSATPGTVTLSISAFEQTGRQQLPAGLFWTAGTGGLALALLGCTRLPRSRRNLGLLVALFSISMVGLSGCGSGVSTLAPINTGTGSTGSTTNSTVGSYIVNVSATGTNSLGQRVTHTTYLTLVVTN